MLKPHSSSCVAQRCARELERLAKIATRGQSCPSDDHDVEKPPPPVVNQPQDLRESCDIILPFTTKELSLLTFDGYPTLSPSMDAPSRAVDGVPPPVAPPPQAETSMSDSEDSNHPLFSSPLPSPILPDNFPFDSFLQWPPRNAEEGYLPWAAISSSGGDGTDGGFQWSAFDFCPAWVLPHSRVSSQQKSGTALRCNARRARLCKSTAFGEQLLRRHEKLLGFLESSWAS